MKKILVIQQKMIGDVLVSSILCNNLKKAWPDARVDYMVYSNTKDVLTGNPNIDRIVEYTPAERNSKKAFLQFLHKIREEKYDIVIDAYSKLESWSTVLFSRASRRISYKKPGRNFLYTDLIDRKEVARRAEKSNIGLAVLQRLALLDPLNLGIEYDPQPKLFLSKEEKERSDLDFSNSRMDMSLKTIMISVLGSSENKTYPLKYKSAILDRIASYQPVNILFNYHPDQKEEAMEVYNHCNPATQKMIHLDLHGNSLRDFIVLMDRCDLIIGNDGGSINLAKALGKPSFTIFSPWIPKEVWATFEDGKKHKSVHLKDFKPALLEKKSQKKIKQEALDLYKALEPKLLFDSLDAFLKHNL